MIVYLFGIEVPDTWVWFANGTAALVLSILLAGCIMSVHVRDGLVMKTGLTLVMFGEIAACVLRLFAAYTGVAPNLAGLGNAHLAINAGLVIAFANFFYRRRRSGKSMRKLSDWTPFDSLPSPMYDFDDTRPSR